MIWGRRKKPPPEEEPMTESDVTKLMARIEAAVDRSNAVYARLEELIRSNLEGPGESHA